MLRFIDARCMLGNRCIIREGDPNTKEDILELMDRCHIEKAVVYHAMAKESELPGGNMALVEETKDNDRFIRQWCALPSYFGEYLSAEDFFAAMKEHHVTSMRLLPKTCGYSLRPHVIGKLMDLAAQCRMPVFISLFEELTSDEVYDLCKAYPDVNFVVGNTGYRENRRLGPAVEQCDNLYLGTGNYVAHCGVELFCKYYGAERLVFDTGLPTGSATAAVSLIGYAEISREEKELIAHGNIERLLGEVTL
ncbi:MAG: hypothetical protein J6J43_06975 [Oscillospiraceae bacterium]|nr:hypothetical protein [Oscillospiraceae bacterium]